MRYRRAFAWLAAYAATLCIVMPAQAGQMLDAIKARGSYKCALGPGTPGLGFPDDKGVWKGFNVDFCRAIAVALFNDPNKVEIIGLPTQQRLPALQAGEVELSAASTTITLLRDTQLGFSFSPPVFYDGQGFMTHKKLNVKSALDLNGATICVQPGSTSELNVTDYFRKNKMNFQPVVIENLSEIQSAFFSGRCDVYTTDISGLYVLRLSRANSDDYVILPERISKEPLALSIRHGDDQWYDLMRWVVYATMEAEELGITSQNVDEMLTSNDPNVRRFLGLEPGLGQALGVDPKWAYNVIKKIGNYAEIFERNYGMGSAFKMQRGINALWTKGGLHYSPPFR